MANLTRQHRFSSLTQWLVLALAIPCVISLLLAGWGLPAVVSTGFCPAAPPDIPAYPCSPLDYVLRMTFGPWAFIGHILVWTAWWALIGAAYMIVSLVRGWRTRSSSHRTRRRTE